MSGNAETTPESLKILEILRPSCVVVDLKGSHKRAVLEELVGLLVAEGKIRDAKATVDVLMQREKLGSTGIGQGIAIPHAKTDQTREVVAAFGLSRRGVQFDALDGEPVHIIFLLVAPPEAAGPHLKALARISRLLKNKFFRQALRDVKSPAEAIRLIRDEDQ